jgi:hypothetical protein
MLILFAFLAAILTFAAARCWKSEDGFTRWFLVSAAGLNLLAFVLMLTSGDEARFQKFERAWTQGDRTYSYFSD